MTRINCIPVQELTTKHLVAEYRELPRLRHAKCYDDIPNSYRLGKGHLKFFYNKGLYLEKRHSALIKEMLDRGYNPTLPQLKLNWPIEFMNDWAPDDEAMRINRKRIEERKSLKT